MGWPSFIQKAFSKIFSKKKIKKSKNTKNTLKIPFFFSNSPIVHTSMPILVAKRLSDRLANLILKAFLKMFSKKFKKKSKNAKLTLKMPYFGIFCLKLANHTY